MKYNTSQLGDVQGAQAAINDQYQKQINQARYQGLSNAIQGQQTRKRMGSMAAEAKLQAMNEKLDPSVRSAYTREAQMYEMLGDQLPFIEPEKQGDFYYRMMATIEDPRRLANELRKTQMQNEAELTKARIYASGQGGGRNQDEMLEQEYQYLFNNPIQSNTTYSTSSGTKPKTPWYQQAGQAIGQVGQGLGTLLAPRTINQPVPTITTPYQEQPMLPMGQGIMRKAPSLFQYPDLIGGFSR